MKPPIILSYKTLKKSGEINEAYSKAIENSGGVLETVETKEDIDRLINHANGILLPGGSDVDPVLYKEEKKVYTGESDSHRDDFEFYLIEKAIERKIPILGICRGLQLLNVKFGGTLYQDVEKEMRNSIKHDYHGDEPRSLIAHDITFKEGSNLSKVLGVETVSVNSLHHQGIKELGQGLIPVGFAPDGLIEAIEMPSYPYLLAVQWHPEELVDSSVWKRFFDSFIQVCLK